MDSTQPNASNAERTTKQLVVMETMRRGSMILAEPAAGKVWAEPAPSLASSPPTHTHTLCLLNVQDDQYYHMMCELSANKKQKERLSGKIKKLQALITEAKKENRETLSVRADFLPRDYDYPLNFYEQQRITNLYCIRWRQWKRL